MAANINTNISTNDKGSPNSDALKMEAALRRKHDMADAMAMIAGRKLEQEKQVNTALKVLDEAKRVQERAGRNDALLQEALDLYQRAIEMLLLILRKNDKNSTHEMLQELIRTALTDAEQIKAQITSKGPVANSQQPTTTTKMSAQGQRSTHPRSTKKLTSSSSSRQLDKTSSSRQLDKTTNSVTNVSGTLSSWWNASQKNITPDNNNKSRTQSKVPTNSSPSKNQTNSPPQINGNSTSATRNKQNSSQPLEPDYAQVRRTSPTAPTSALSERDRQFQNQILDDFYIPSTTLQKTTWNDVAGLEEVKQALQESVILPLQRPDLFTGLRRPQNLLLYGPPGTGKTLLIRAAASTSNALLFQCSAASLTSKWMGDSEKVVRALFQVAKAAAQRHNTPALLFLDEVDSVLSNRSSDGENEASRRLKTEFMIQMEGLSSVQRDSGEDATVLVLACTNCPWDLDPAVLRRFPRRLYVPLPDLTARQALLRHLLKTQFEKNGCDHDLDDRDTMELAVSLEGYSGSDILAIASQAAFGPVRDVNKSALATIQSLRPVSRQDWDRAIASVQKTVTPKLLQQYQQWNNQQ